jgi:hypothetical protein
MKRKTHMANVIAVVTILLGAALIVAGIAAILMM